MAEQFEVIGADRFAATNTRVARQLGDLSVINGIVARYVASRASAYAPRLTGRLAYSITGAGEMSEARVSTSVPYAGVQEFGWPGHNIEPHRYMSRASREGEPLAVRLHAANLERLVGTIEGA